MLSGHHPSRRHSLSALPLPMHSRYDDSTPEPNCSRRRHTLWPHMSLWPGVLAPHNSNTKAVYMRTGTDRDKAAGTVDTATTTLLRAEPAGDQASGANHTAPMSRPACTAHKPRPVPPTKWTPAHWLQATPPRGLLHALYPQETVKTADSLHREVQHMTAAGQDRGPARGFHGHRRGNAHSAHTCVQERKDTARQSRIHWVIAGSRRCWLSLYVRPTPHISAHQHTALHARRQLMPLLLLPPPPQLLFCCALVSFT